jgi:hypothetical protein
MISDVILPKKKSIYNLILNSYNLNQMKSLKSGVPCRSKLTLKKENKTVSSD